jgi:hypothetical protein
MEVKDQVLHIVSQLNHGFDEWQTGEENENGERPSAYDYLSEVLDLQWIIRQDKELVGTRLLVAFGGPNIWIDTARGIVEGYWWGDNFSSGYNTDSEFSRELNDALEELYNC